MPRQAGAFDLDRELRYSGEHRQLAVTARDPDVTLRGLDRDDPRLTRGERLRLGGRVVGTGGRRALVAVQLGLFDTTGGRVEVAGPLRQGDRVVVPSS